MELLRFRGRLGAFDLGLGHLSPFVGHREKILLLILDNTLAWR